MDMAKGKISDVIAIRLHRGEDVIGSIKEACLKYGVENGVIISIIGSLDGAAFFDPVINPSVKCGISYADPIILERPVQLLTAQGEISHYEGDLRIHLHAAFADSNGNAYGGHIEEGNKSLNTINIFIGVIDGVDLGYKIDELFDLPALYPKEINK